MILASWRLGPMKLNHILLIALVAIPTFPSQQEARYSYDVWGTVTDSDGRKMENIYVCVLPSKRPINGRIPCVKTGSNGSFAITVKDIPDVYTVCASTKESTFILIPNKDPSHRVVCSEPIVFPPHDDSRKVDLKFTKEV
jgi:hypothetical protein